MPNRLAQEKSPYLLQHADNPVDWYPWGEEALERARVEDKPMLVSIGYSACHWCHVMERESFEDEATARLMNENFVNIKVDREERPDVDAIYMEAVQALSGQGGWPLNVFLTPDGRPFFGGTYFPPRPVHGMSSWSQVLGGVAEAFNVRRSDILHNADVLTGYIRQAQNLSPSDGALDENLLTEATDTILQHVDWNHGGFGGPPKFPQPLALDFLLRMFSRFGHDRSLECVEMTARRMARGGIYDHLGGGFHRYTVDGEWVVPHFEKMLYDNVLLATMYLHLYQVTGDGAYRSVVEQTLDYLLRDMRSPEGAFYSAEDADSEGVEGRYYVWTPEDLRDVLGEERASIAALHFGVTAAGNFEGKTILTVRSDAEDIGRTMGMELAQVQNILKDVRTDLRTARACRVAPGKDTKILTSWNALAISALAESGRVLRRLDYLDAAKGAADFIVSAMRSGRRLVRSYRNGPSSIPGFLEDYAFLANGLLTLYETSFESRYLSLAGDVADEMLRSFGDESHQALYDVAADSQTLVVRPRSFFDNPIPSGNSAAAMALLRLHALTGQTEYGERALPVFRAARALVDRAPLGFACLLSALDFYLSPQMQVAIVGDPESDDTQTMIAAVFERYLPNTVVAVGEGSEVPLLAGRERLDGRSTAYVCEHFVCKLPVMDVNALAAQIT